MKICPSCGHKVTSKKKLTLSVNADLIDFARRNNINISEMVEKFLIAAKRHEVIHIDRKAKNR